MRRTWLFIALVLPMGCDQCSSDFLPQLTIEIVGHGQVMATGHLPTGPSLFGLTCKGPTTPQNSECVYTLQFVFSQDPSQQYNVDFDYVADPGWTLKSGCGRLTYENPVAVPGFSQDSQTCSVEFVPATTLTLDVTVKGPGTVRLDPAGVVCSDHCSEDVTNGGQATLTATAASDARFTGWSGDCAGLDAAQTVTVDASKTCTATFGAIRELTIQRDGNGTGQIHVTVPEGAFDCGSVPCHAGVAEGEPVMLAATADAGSFFAGWSAGCSAGFTMSGDTTCTATFSLLGAANFPVGIGTEGIGLGDVTADHPGLDCSGICEVSAPFPAMTVLIFTAAARTDSFFAGWKGDCASAGTSPTATITVNGPMSCTAEFESLVKSSLMVTKTGTSDGTVTSDVPGINCGTLDCFFIFDHGARVTLTAAAASDSHFSGWGGDCASAGLHPTVTLTLNANASCTAQFDPGPPPPQTLTATKNGAGHGTVTSVPAGISCGATCSGAFAGESTVTLTATPDAGSSFVAWSGDCMPSVIMPNVAVATMFGPQTCNAEFEPAPTHTLTVLKGGLGSGHVSSSPAGIDCGPTCAASFASGTTVTLAAVADSGSSFAGWSGACSGTAVTAPVTLSADKTCTATFNPVTTGCGTIHVAQDGRTLYLNASNTTGGPMDYYWSYSWLTTQPPPTGSSTSIAAPTPGTYTISVFIVGPECSTSTMFTVM